MDKLNKQGGDRNTKTNGTEYVEPELIEFRCYACGLKEHCEYRSVADSSKSIVKLKEDSFVMKDPFCAGTEKDSFSFIIIGASCSLCHRSVCCDTSCSIFYVKRFCSACAFLHKDKFPAEVKADIEKMYAMRKH